MKSNILFVSLLFLCSLLFSGPGCCQLMKEDDLPDRESFRHEVETSKLEGRNNLFDTNPSYPVLIYDEKERATLPRNFRTSKTPFASGTLDAPSRLGLDDLNVSGSGQFTGQNIKNLQLELASISNDSNIYIVDLRQESHGFLDDTPISWYGYRDSANAGKTNAEIAQEENNLLSKLRNKIVKKTTVYMRVKPPKSSKTSENKIKENSEELTDELSVTEDLNPVDNIKFLPTEFAYEKVYNEEEIVKNQNLNYMRFYIQDYHAPSDAEVERFLEFVKTLPKNAWLHFHCHAGRGRTTTFMVMYDIIRNAQQVDLEDIIKRQALIGGKDLFETETTKTWKIPTSKERQDFITNFYNRIKAQR